MKAKFILIVGLLVMALFTGKVTGQSSIGSVIFINNGPSYPAQNQPNYYQSNVGGGNGGAIMPFIPTGSSTWTVTRLGSDPPNNSDFWSINQFSGDNLTLNFPCGGSASFTLNGGSYNIVLNSSGCFDAAATALENILNPALDNSRDTGPDDKKDDCGMPVWGVTEPFISLWLSDEPLGYQPAIGPRISFELNYSQREDADGFSQNIFSVGKKWKCSWLSYVVLNGIYKTVNFSGGGKASYYGSGTIDYRNNTQLTGDITNGFTVSYPDGRKDFYGFIITNAAGAFQQAFLSQRFNAVGQNFTLNYSAYQPAAPIIRLKSLVDGDGRTNVIFYNDTNVFSTNLISRVVDPFGRTNYLAYDSSGNLTGITDVAGNFSSVNYDTNNWATSLTTPYGTTFIAITDGTNSASPNGRKILVTRPDNSHELFLYSDTAVGQPDYYPINEIPTMFGIYAPQTQHPLSRFNSFHWGPRQYAALSTTNLAGFTANDIRKARMRHWKLDNSTPTARLDNLVAMERDPSPDSAGAVEGQKTWYYYYGGDFVYAGIQFLPWQVGRLLPDGHSAVATTYRNSWGNVLTSIASYPMSSGGDIFNDARTNTFSYAANGIDVVALTNTYGVQVASNAYNSFHQVLNHFDALNELTSYTYNTNQQISSMTLPTGLVTTNIFGADHFVAQTVVTGLATNSFTYTNDLVLTHTDARGLATTNTWDKLNRLTGTAFPDGSMVSNLYTKLDLTATKDRMGHWTYFGYDNLRRNTALTNALQNVTLYNYCTCGALESVLDAATNLTQFFYDNQGNLTNTIYADNFASFKNYNLLRQVVTMGDSTGQRLTNTYNNQGLLVSVSNAFGRVQTTAYDALDRVTNSVDANGVSIGTTFDKLNRPLTRSYPDGGVEKWNYTLNVSGHTSHTNQIGNVTLLAFDALGRMTNEVSVGVTTNSFAFDGAGDQLTFTDGRSQTTHWNYDAFGRVTNKVDAAGVIQFVYQYDANDQVTNRWTPAKGNTTYIFDAVGNRKNINYPLATVSYSYDALNRLTNMVDSLGTSSFVRNAAGELMSAGGLWTGDTVTYNYANRLRTRLTLATWTNNYFYDQGLRLTNLTSGAGSFGYRFDATRPLEMVKLTLPNTAYITNNYDAVARLAATALRDSGNAVLDGYTYGYNLAGQRTNIARNFGAAVSTVSARYDARGQLTSWTAKETNGTPRLHEQLGYLYDAAGNLQQRTNNALVQAFTVDAANALTNLTRSGNLTVSGNTLAPAGSITVNGQPAVSYGDLTFASSNGFALADGANTFTTIAQTNAMTVTNTLAVNLPQNVTLLYDANGNLTNDGLKSLSYDTENQLTNAQVAGQWKNEYAYDGLNRRRITRDYSWNGSGWVQTNEVRLIYDGWQIIQERDTNNAMLVTYTRGPDLSGTLDEAGGIGGLLSRTDTSGTDYYHADGSGNVTALMNASQHIVGRYLYGPFGKLLGQWGPRSGANVIRFSSKPYLALTDDYDFGFRRYRPDLQRFENSDPIQEQGGWNLYGYVYNNPVNYIDSFGLDIYTVQEPGVLGHEYLFGDNPDGSFWYTDKMPAKEYFPYYVYGPGSINYRDNAATDPLTDPANAVKRIPLDCDKTKNARDVAKAMSQKNPPPAYCLIGANCRSYVESFLPTPPILPGGSYQNAPPAISVPIPVPIVNPL